MSAWPGSSQFAGCTTLGCAGLCGHWPKPLGVRTDRGIPGAARRRSPAIRTGHLVRRALLSKTAVARDWARDLTRVSDGWKTFLRFEPPALIAMLSTIR